MPRLVARRSRQRADRLRPVGVVGLFSLHADRTTRTRGARAGKRREALPVVSSQELSTEHVALAPGRSGLGLLTEWLSTHSVGIGSNVVLAPGDSPLAARSFEAGETLLELRSGACLTARAAYADRELGRDLQDIAAQVGPGFDTVALATLCAAERVRGFQAEAWYAGSSAAEQAPCTPHHAH